MKNTITAIDFGTSKIVALIAETGNRQRCDIVGAGFSAYEGFADGQWNDPENVNTAISAAIREAEAQAHIHIRDINVGVPGEFSRVYAIETKVSIQGADPRVSVKDIEEIFRKAIEEMGNVRGVIIHRSPAWFTVDNGKKILEPVGLRGYELRAMVSFVVADQFFLDDISERFRSMNITVNSFFSTPTGQAMLFISEEERDRTALLIDIGYLNTEVMAVEGEALIYHKVIPIGGGNISADIAYGLDIPLDAAEQIKRSYVFSLSSGQPSFDAVDKNGEKKTFMHDEVGKVLEPRVEEIADTVKECVKQSGVRLNNWSVTYLTGGGLAMNRGGRDYLSGKMDRSVRELPHKAAKLDKPIYSSSLGLLDLIIDTVHNTRNTSGGFRSLLNNLLGN